MKFPFSALVSLIAFICGFFVSSFAIYTLTRFGTPNPAFAKSLFLKRDFWILVLGIAFLLGGSIGFYWRLTPSSHLKDFVQGTSPLVFISIVFSTLSLMVFPISHLIGPWDIIEALLLMIAVGLTQLISLVTGLLSLAGSGKRVFPAIAIFWCLVTLSIIYGGVRL